MKAKLHKYTRNLDKSPTILFILFLFGLGSHIQSKLTSHDVYWTPLHRLNFRVSVSYTCIMVKVALITGASRGLGKAIALRLARDGCNIALNDIPAMAKDLEAVHNEITGIGREALICLGDVSVESNVVNMIDLTVSTLGSLDVMVANAGICIVNTLTETSAEDFHRLFSINVDGTFFCYKYAGLQMIKQGRGGRIIGASSLAGKQGWKPLAGYCATKFAVRGLTQAAAAELAAHKITVNAYAPGPTSTDMVVDLRGTVNNRLSQRPDYDDAPNKLGGTVGLSTPEQIAGLVAYLVTDEAETITGQSVSINDGRFFD